MTKPLLHSENIRRQYQLSLNSRQHRQKTSGVSKEQENEDIAPQEIHPSPAKRSDLSKLNLPQETEKIISDLSQRVDDQLGNNLSFKPKGQQSLANGGERDNNDDDASELLQRVNQRAKETRAAWERCLRRERENKGSLATQSRPTFTTTDSVTVTEPMHLTLQPMLRDSGGPHDDAQAGRLTLKDSSGDAQVFNAQATGSSTISRKRKLPGEHDVGLHKPEGTWRQGQQAPGKESYQFDPKAPKSPGASANKAKPVWAEQSRRVLDTSGDASNTPAADVVSNSGSVAGCSGRDPRSAPPTPSNARKLPWPAQRHPSWAKQQVPINSERVPATVLSGQSTQPNSPTSPTSLASPITPQAPAPIAVMTAQPTAMGARRPSGTGNVSSASVDKSRDPRRRHPPR